MAVEKRVSEASSVREFFHEQWLQLTELLGMEADVATPGVSDRLALAAAVDTVVQGTDARMRAVSNYKKRLRTGTRVLLEHIDDLVNRMPMALKLSRESFVYDPQVRAFFPSMAGIELLCRQNNEIDEYISSSCASGSDSFFALLFLNYSEKEIYTTELQGDILQRDVRKTGIVFTGHRFLAPAANNTEIRWSLKRILFENVIEYLKVLLGHRRQAETEQQLSGAAASDGIHNLSNPSEYLDTLVELLELPLDLVGLHENTVRINPMGIKLPDSVGSSGEDIRLQHLEIGEENTNLIALTEISLASMNSGS